MFKSLHQIQGTTTETILKVKSFDIAYWHLWSIFFTEHQLWKNKDSTLLSLLIFNLFQTIYFECKRCALYEQSSNCINHWLLVQTYKICSYFCSNLADVCHWHRKLVLKYSRNMHRKCFEVKSNISCWNQTVIVKRSNMAFQLFN